jgi:hypothetical protein
MIYVLRQLGPEIAVGVFTCISGTGGMALANLEPKAIIDEHRAAVLLGIAPPELRWLSRVLGLGYKLESGGASQVFFTYEELKRLSSAAAASAK